jgi:RNA polymerase sigma factor (sigma-70 family)
VSALFDHRSGPGSDDPLSGRPPSGSDPVGSPDHTGPDHTGTDHTETESPASATQVVRREGGSAPGRMRADFGAHLEANYPRLVAQLFAITLDAGEAHDVVQDAYSRAWRQWAVVGSSPDPTAWVRRVAVRATMRSWRRLLARVGLVRSAPPSAEGVDPHTIAMLAVLARLPVAERRAVVLSCMAGMPLSEIAALEEVPPGTVQARVSRARQVVSADMADLLPAVPGPYDDDLYGGNLYGEPAGSAYDGGEYR